MEGTPPAGWGGNPVPVRSASGMVRRGVSSHVAPPPGRRVPDELGHGPVADLLALRGRDQRRAAGALLATGPSAAEGGRRVVVGGLAGGVGTSTTVALVWRVWRAHGVPAVIADAAGDWEPGLAERIEPGELTATPTWSDLTGRPAEVLVKEFDAVRGISAAGSVLITDGPHSRRPADLVETTVAVARAACRSWPLVIVDAGHGFAVRDLVAADEPDLLVLVCRASAPELRAAAEFLRSADRAGLFDAHRRAVLCAVGGAEAWRGETAAAVAASADATAGTVRLMIDHRLATRTTGVLHVPTSPAAEVLAAAAAPSPLPTPRSAPSITKEN